MKQIALIVGATTALLLACAGEPQISSRTKVISIGFHSDDCTECKDLESKMRRMNLRFALSPIVFIKYDKTSDATRLAAESHLENAGMREIALRDDGLRKVILYNAQTRERIETIEASDPVSDIRRKISSALRGER